MKEIWKDIKGYEGLYQVSNLGRVKRNRFINIHTNKEKERIKSQKLRKDGYLEIALYKEGKAKYIQVHRIVAESFISKAENKLQVNHINGIKTDNNVLNLEWTTASENSKHRSRTLQHGKLKAIKQYTLDGKYIASYPSIQIASEKTGINATNICRVLKGGRHRAGNYKWKYDEISRCKVAVYKRKGEYENVKNI